MSSTETLPFAFAVTRSRQPVTIEIGKIADGEVALPSQRQLVVVVLVRKYDGIEPVQNRPFCISRVIRTKVGVQMTESGIVLDADVSRAHQIDRVLHIWSKAKALLYRENRCLEFS